jgi:predicted phage terminase large subunit-like protein
LFRQAYQRWAPAVQGVEVAGLGLTLFQYLQRSGLPVVELKPDRDKVTRALPAAARYQSGSVYHYKPAVWLDAVEEELIGFPHAAHDDFVDTLSYAVRLMVPMMQSQTVPVTYEEPYEISPV